MRLLADGAAEATAHVGHQDVTCCALPPTWRFADAFDSHDGNLYCHDGQERGLVDEGWCVEYDGVHRSLPCSNSISGR